MKPIHLFKYGFACLLITITAHLAAQDNSKPGATEREFRKNKFFNITQVALLNFQLKVNNDLLTKANNNQTLRLFNSLTSINGYQFVPGFCTGIGVTFNNYDMPVVSNNYSYFEVPNAPFLPVFLDIRSHFSRKGIAPFIKFDLGYNVLLKRKSTVIGWGNYTYKPDIGEVTSGGLYLSPGIGVKIPVFKKAELIFTVDYSMEKSSMRTIQYWVDEEYNEHTYERSSTNTFNFLKINFGLGF